MATDQARGQVTQCTCTEPQSHHLTAHSFRCQQRHCRQANRTQAQFTKRQHQNAAHQPERRNACTAIIQHVLCCQHHQAKTRCGTQNTDNKFSDTARANVHAGKLWPRPAKDRGQQDDKQRVNRLEPDCRDFKIADHTVSVVVSEQVKRRWLLLKCRPEEGSGNQQNKADQQSGALFTVQPSKYKQVDEVEGYGCRNHIHQHAGYRDRVNHNHTLSYQDNNDSHTYRQRQQPRAHALSFDYRAVPGRVQPYFAVVAFHRRNSKHAEDNQRDQHPDTTDTKAPMPAMRFNQPPGDQRSNEGAHIDTHVEQRETAITAGIAFFIQRPNHYRDTGLEQT